VRKKIDIENPIQVFWLIVKYYFISLGRILAIRGNPLFVPPSAYALWISALLGLSINVFGFKMAWGTAIALLVWKIIFVIFVFLKRPHIQPRGMQTIAGLFAMEWVMRGAHLLANLTLAHHIQWVNAIMMILLIWQLSATSAYFQSAFVLRVRGAIVLTLIYVLSSVLVEIFL
jgi:hypothetical protein